MDMREFSRMVKNGIHPVVTFLDAIEDKEGYLEKGMRGRVTGAIVDGDDLVTLTVDLTEFDEYNKAFESKGYFDKNRNPVLTAREAGYYKPVDTVYFDADEEMNGFMEIESAEALAIHQEYLSSGSLKPYVQWLEEALLGARNTIEGRIALKP